MNVYRHISKTYHSGFVDSHSNSLLLNLFLVQLDLLGGPEYPMVFQKFRIRKHQ